MSRLQIPGDAFVRREHELFDEAVRDVALGARNTFHQSEFVEFDYRLRQIEIDGTATLTLAIEEQCEIAHQFEGWRVERTAGAEWHCLLAKRLRLCRSCARPNESRLCIARGRG